MPRPNSRDPATDPAAFLGDELGRAREAAGYKSQQALADHLGFDRSVVGKAESGERPPSPDVLAAWCHACGLDHDHFCRMATLARRAEGPIPRWFEDWLVAEGEAQTLRIWQPLLIPGIMQTAEYARALFLAGQSDTSDEAISALVAARLARQSVFEKADPPDVSVVLDETVLHRMIGSSKVMRDALDHLVELSERPYIILQVIPAGNGANAGLGGAFDLASADGMPDTLRMEGVEDQTTEKRTLVRKAGVAFNRVRGDALSRDVSRDLIRKVAEQKWNE